MASPTLATPPPNPVNAPASPQGSSGFGGVPGTPVPPQGPPAGGGGQSPEAVVKVGTMLDQALLSLAQVIPDAGPEFSQARQLIKIGIAKYLTAGPGPVSVSPTATGPQFQGGGIGSAQT